MQQNITNRYPHIFSVYKESFLYYIIDIKTVLDMNLSNLLDHKTVYFTVASDCKNGYCFVFRPASQTNAMTPVKQKHVAYTDRQIELSVYFHHVPYVFPQSIHISVMHLCKHMYVPYFFIYFILFIYLFIHSLPATG